MKGVGCFQTDTGIFGNFSLQVRIWPCYSHFHLFLLHRADPLPGAAAQGSFNPSQGGEKASLFFFKGKRRVPAFDPELLVPRSPVRCLAPAKIQGNKITGESFLETHPCSLWASLLSPPALHKGQAHLKNWRMKSRRRFLPSAAHLVRATIAPFPAHGPLTP